MLTTLAECFVVPGLSLFNEWDFKKCCCFFFLHCFLQGFKIEPPQKKEWVKFIFIEKACYVIVFPDWVFISSWLVRTFGGLICGTRAAAECMLSLGAFKNRRLLKVSMWFKLRFLSTRSELWPVTSGNNHVTVRLAKLATTKPLNRVQKRHKLPAGQYLRCSVSSKSTMPPSLYPRERGLRNPPPPPAFLTELQTTRARWQVSFAYKWSMPSEERGHGAREGKGAAFRCCLVHRKYPAAETITD